MKASQYLWGLYLLLYPFYFLPPGGFQIADLVGVLLLVVNGKTILFQATQNSFVRYLMYFALYSVVVNLIWMVILDDFVMLKASMFYSYALLFVLCLNAKVGDINFLKFTQKAIIVTLVLQLILWPFVPDQGVRTQLYFNNPNQLALWGLTMLVLFNTIAQVLETKTIVRFAVTGLCTFMIVLSASKAALGASLLFWGFFLLKERKYTFTFAFIALLVASVVIAEYDLSAKDFSVIDKVKARMEHDNLSDDSLAGRGYDRIWNHPEYLFLGAGEGKEQRFDSFLKDGELHSVIFNIFFSYGLVGLFLFVMALVQIVKQRNRQNTLLLAMLMIFTLVHMVLRIPLFWLSLLFLYKVLPTNFINDKELAANVRN